ncbi:hypothetical protein C8J57DRAFT_1265102 [Mycena rebaudengoi]|nr:hypothetical protein C8J57DRAFT_1265102 [Mycena rebaudengoi]
MDNSHHTRARTRAGEYPAPPPIFSPRLSFGSVAAGDYADTSAIDSSMRPVALATRPAPASAVGISATPVASQPSALRAGEHSSELSSAPNEVDFFGAIGDAPAPIENVDDGGWTPVTRKTSRSHRERSNSSRGNYTHNYASDSDASDSESTYARATNEMSNEDLATLARRHEAYATQLREQMARNTVPKYNSDVKGNYRGFTPEDVGSEVESEQPPSPLQRATIEEVDSKEDLISFQNPVAGTTRDKGKGVDPGNWGDVSALQNFSESDLKAQQEMLQNYAEIHRVMKEEQSSTPTNIFAGIGESASMPPSLKGKGRRRRSKSPKVKKTKVETRVEIPPKPSKPVEEVEFVEPTKSEEIGIVSDRDANNDRVSTSGLTNDEMHAILKQKISELHELERQFVGAREPLRHTAPPKPARESRAPKAPIPRDVTPGRIAAENFFEKALRGAPAASAEAKPPPSDPSDSSSSSSSDDESGSSRRGASSPRLSSKRRRGHARKQKMLLKPIPPSRYNGEPNANAIQRFARESKTYVKMGRVPEEEQVYFISYYLDGKALDFYNQIVTVDEESWTLKRFFVELFEFCFPIDFRNMQRKRLNRCFQGTKEVAAHVAEWSEIYNTIGLEDNHEKVVKLFNSFAFPVQTEIYRKGLDPEISSWEEIVKGAEQAEILLKLKQRIKMPRLDLRSGLSGRRESQKSFRCGFRGRGRGGRVNSSPRQREEVMRTSAVGAPPKNKPAKSEMSAQQRNDMLAKGLCFECGEAGHLARNCPKKNTVPSKNKGKPPGFNSHAVHIPHASTSRDALYESTEVLDTFYVGAMHFGDISGVDEGGEPLQTFGGSESEFELDSDHSSQHDVDSADGDAPSCAIGDLAGFPPSNAHFSHPKFFPRTQNRPTSQD